MSDNIDRKLWKVAEAGDEDLVSHFMDQATVDWRGDGDFTALHNAAYKGRTPVVTRLLDAGWSLEARSVSGDTPLSLVAGAGHLETAKCLMLRGANMDTQSNYMRTPLHWASYNGHNEVIRTLVQCRANQQIRNGLLGSTAEDDSRSDETRVVFREFYRKGLDLDTKEELFDKAVEEKNYDDAAVLAYNSQDTNILNKFLEILDTDDRVKDLFFLDFFNRSVSFNLSAAQNILHHLNKNASSFNGNNTHSPWCFE